MNCWASTGVPATKMASIDRVNMAIVPELEKLEKLVDTEELAGFEGIWARLCSS